MNLFVRSTSNNKQGFLIVWSEKKNTLEKLTLPRDWPAAHCFRRTLRVSRPASVWRRYDESQVNPLQV